MMEKVKLTAKERSRREGRINLLASEVPEIYRPAYKTLLRQGGWLTHSSIKSGCNQSKQTGMMIAGLCRSGFITESSVVVNCGIGESYVARAWKPVVGLDE